MNILVLIFTVCRLASADVCNDIRVAVDQQLPVSGCLMQAQPIMAQWIGDNPGWAIKRWRCEYSGNRREET
jgi:hypothetical protein